MSNRLILVVGKGAREHALARRLADEGHQIWVCPGNEGIALDPRLKCVISKEESIGSIVEEAMRLNVDLVVVGPEALLAEGLSDALWDVGIPCFGPRQAAAQLEASKVFAKELMNDLGVPTARSRTFMNADLAQAFLNEAPWPVVVKGAGLAGGKGVIVAHTLQGAHDAVDVLFESHECVIIEERLRGEEVSVTALCDGGHFALLPPARDFKRLREGGRGPNTGGMGAIAPIDLSEHQETIRRDIFEPILTSLMARGTPFGGALYAGLMLTESGPKVLEFNVRFGDPETQAMLELLPLGEGEENLGDLLFACATSSLEEKWKGGAWLKTNGQAACAVVLADGEYPKGPYAPVPLEGLESAQSISGVSVFHAATQKAGEKLFVKGGRLLSVVGRAATLNGARALSAKALSKTEVKGARFRKDIIEPPKRKRLVVMVSGEGTNLQALINACEVGTLDAEVVMVLSNRESANALARGAQAGAECAVVSHEDKTRDAFSAELAEVILSESPDLVVMAGFDRIVSAPLLEVLGDRLINLHPALPGKFPGQNAMRRAYDDQSVQVSGVMVHVASSLVDEGRVLKSVEVEVDRALDFAAFKKRMHEAEHALLVEVVAEFCRAG